MINIEKRVDEDSGTIVETHYDENNNIICTIESSNTMDIAEDTLEINEQDKVSTDDVMAQILLNQAIILAKLGGSEDAE